MLHIFARSVAGFCEGKKRERKEEMGVRIVKEGKWKERG